MVGCKKMCCKLSPCFLYWLTVSPLVAQSQAFSCFDCACLCVFFLLICFFIYFYLLSSPWETIEEVALLFLVPFLSDKSLGKILWDGCWNTWLKCVVLLSYRIYLSLLWLSQLTRSWQDCFRGEKQGLISTWPFVQDIFLAGERNCPGVFIYSLYLFFWVYVVF